MMKGQKGITLVALIITIIVMLILVGVSIAVALDGGLFDTARGAAKNYTDNATYEQGLDYITYNGQSGQNAIDEAAKAE